MDDTGTRVPKNGVSRSKRLLEPQPLPHQYWGLELRTSLTKAGMVRNVVRNSPTHHASPSPSLVGRDRRRNTAPQNPLFVYTASNLAVKTHSGH